MVSWLEFMSACDKFSGYIAQSAVAPSATNVPIDTNTVENIVCTYIPSQGGQLNIVNLNMFITESVS